MDTTLNEPNILFFGQPGSGKTTLANLFAQGRKIIVIDGDDLRAITDNDNYSPGGRRVNISNACMFTKLLNRKGYSTALAMVAPYRNLREMIRTQIPNTVFIQLFYDETHEQRGREHYWVNDFEQEPIVTDNSYTISTSNYTIEETLVEINKIYRYASSKIAV